MALLALRNNQPLLTDVYAHKRFRGNYFLVGFNARLDNTGEPYWEVIISDYTGSLTLYCRDQSCIDGEILPQRLVHIEARLEQLSAKAYFRCKLLSTCFQQAYKFGNVSQLPCLLCPRPTFLRRLVDLIESIANSHIKTFVIKILLKPNVAIRFISSPASLDYQHNYAGGLLVHSVEVAETFAKSIKNSYQRDLAIVAALLHDIGKTQTLTADLTSTAEGLVNEYCELKHEICSVAIQELAHHHINAANHLQLLWAHESIDEYLVLKPMTQVPQSLWTNAQQNALPSVNAINAIK